MTERFTAQDAIEAHEDGEPIMVSAQWLATQCRAHGLDDASEFYEEIGQAFGTEASAGRLFMWLGY